MIVKRISLLFLVVCVVKTTHAELSDTAKKVATAAVCSIASRVQLPKHVYQFGNHTLLKQLVDVGCVSLENLRDKGVQVAYKNQDCVAVGNLKGNAFFGVFDGHGRLGRTIAERLQKELVRRVLLSKKPAQSLKKSFADMQKMFQQLPDAQKAGATALVAVLEDATHLTLAHVGDSRAVVIRHGKVMHATVDHKPTNPAEKERIEKQGGYVANGRAVDSLHMVSYALSRSMGDVVAQERALTAEPDISAPVMVQKDDIIILATDGVWDVFTNEQIASFSDSTKTAQEIAQAIVMSARDKKSIDDITALVVRIK